MNDMQWTPIGPSEPVPPPLPPSRVDFTGNRTEFRKMVTKGAMRHGVAGAEGHLRQRENPSGTNFV